LRRILKDLDLVFIDPLDPAIRAVGAPFLRDAVQAQVGLQEKLLRRNKELAEAGFHAQVHIEPETSLFFVLDGERRINLKRQNGGSEFVAKDRRYTAAELAASAESISPNAILRPVLQDYLLPTAAYVGGPAELAYFAQSEVLYKELLGRMPVMLARNGFTLVGARAQKLLDRYGLTVPATFVRQDELRARIASCLVPDALKGRFQEAGRTFEQTLQTLESDLTTFDPSLAKAMAKSRAKIQYQLAKIGKKTARETLRRDERSNAEAQFLSNMLYPEGHLQERYFSILPFLAQYGPDLIGDIARYSCLDCVDHHILPV
jgi:bacillithiol biosynthesis cysteine-adding enzyme BshC